MEAALAAGRAAAEEVRADERERRARGAARHRARLLDALDRATADAITVVAAVRAQRTFEALDRAYADAEAVVGLCAAVVAEREREGEGECE